MWNRLVNASQAIPIQSEVLRGDLSFSEDIVQIMFWQNVVILLVLVLCHQVLWRSLRRVWMTSLPSTFIFSSECNFGDEIPLRG